MDTRRLRGCSPAAAPLAAAGLTLLLAAAPAGAEETPDWRPAAIAALQAAPHDRIAEAAALPRPPMPLPAPHPGIQPPAPVPPPPPPPALGSSPDPNGVMATFTLAGSVPPGTNPFFESLGTNGRSCGSCHQPQDAWSVSAADVQARFTASSGNDPIFRPVDGAVCPTANVSTPAAKQQAYSLLTSRGLIRIGMPVPSNTAFSVTVNSDPYHCTTSASTGLTSPTSGIVSVYRRPLPSTNLDYLSDIMWDGREPSLSQQATDAVLGHEQATTAPTSTQLAQTVTFESGLFTAQLSDTGAGSLTASGATGGPTALANERTGFFFGVNDPFGGNPTHAPFNPNVFTAFASWSANPSAVNANAQSVARGEVLFNTFPINIAGVGGLNDVRHETTIKGSCSTCHDTPNAGDHSLSQFLDIGVAASTPPPGLNVAGLPVFTLHCLSGTLAGENISTTDPGRALVTGNCADIGHFKVPTLRGLDARAPYFHNGSAPNLQAVVAFYNGRFKMNLNPQQQQDLVNFLGSL